MLDTPELFYYYRVERLCKKLEVSMDTVITIDIFRIIKAILKKWYFVVLVATCAALIMFAYKYDTVTKYYANATVYSSAYGSYAATAEGVKAMQLYAELVTSNKIAERAVSILGDNSLDVDKVRSMVYANAPEDSTILLIGANGTDPYKTIAVANAAAEAFIIEAQNITGGQGVQILDKADTAKVIPNPIKRNCVIAFLAGAFFVCGLIALGEIFSNRIYHVEDASLDGEIEILGIIPTQKMD